MLTRKTPTIAICAVGALVLTLTLFRYSDLEAHSSYTRICSPDSHQYDTGSLFSSSSNHNATVHGTPSLRFRENLWEDKTYMTSWGSGGFTNTYMSYMNLIYISKLGGYIPIIPPVSRSHHIDAGSRKLYLSDIIDLQTLREGLNTPILEWRDVKREDSTEIEALGCWSPVPQQGMPGQEKRSNLEEVLGLDVANTNIPDFVGFRGQGGIGMSMWGMITLQTPERRARALRQHPSPFASRLGNFYPPDEQLFCVDWLFYSGMLTASDGFNTDYAPTWKFVAQHARWTPTVNDLANGFLRKAFGLAAGAPIPNFIALHVRRADFDIWCPADIPRADCLPALSDFAHRVEEIKKQLRTRTRNPIDNIQHVLITSNEPRIPDGVSPDPTDDAALESQRFWKEAEGYGWYSFNHDAEGTAENFGPWYPMVLDSVFQSKAIGFVGTQQSSFSLLARLRVETWNGGVSRVVQWGSKGADARCWDDAEPSSAVCPNGFND